MIWLLGDAKIFMDSEMRKYLWNGIPVHVLTKIMTHLKKHPFSHSNFVPFFNNIIRERLSWNAILPVASTISTNLTLLSLQAEKCQKFNTHTSWSDLIRFRIIPRTINWIQRYCRLLPPLECWSRLNLSSLSWQTKEQGIHSLRVCSASASWRAVKNQYVRTIRLLR